MKAQTNDCPLNVNGWNAKNGTNKHLRSFENLTSCIIYRNTTKSVTQKFRMRSRIAQGAFQYLGKVRMDRNIFLLRKK